MLEISCTRRSVQPHSRSVCKQKQVRTCVKVGGGAWTYCMFQPTWVWSLNVCAAGGTLNLHICHLQCTFFAGVSIKLLLPACTIVLSAFLFFFFEAKIIELLDWEASCLGRAAARKWRLSDRMWRSHQNPNASHLIHWCVTFSQVPHPACGLLCAEANLPLWRWGHF